MTYLEIARQELPGLSDEELDYILWEHTGFPGFWDNADTETIEDCLRRQLRTYKKSVNAPSTGKVT